MTTATKTAKVTRADVARLLPDGPPVTLKGGKIVAVDNKYRTNRAIARLALGQDPAEVCDAEGYRSVATMEYSVKRVLAFKASKEVAS